MDDLKQWLIENAKLTEVGAEEFLDTLTDYQRATLIVTLIGVLEVLHERSLLECTKDYMPMV